VRQYYSDCRAEFGSGARSAAWKGEEWQHNKTSAVPYDDSAAL
jgi:hypothetical protein